MTGERIRDKIPASKRKGMWMGGMVPLGYDVCNRRLAINAAEAQLVRQIYQRYLELGSVGLIRSRKRDVADFGQAVWRLFCPSPGRQKITRSEIVPR